jgi:CheY-like chemotaxis protein
MSAPDNSQKLRAAANELNNLLQVMGSSVQGLYAAARHAPEAGSHHDIIRDCIQRSAATIRLIMDELAAHGDVPAPAGEPHPARQSPAIPQPPPVPVVHVVQDHALVVNPGGSMEMVMVVDDEELICRHAEQVLAGQGHRVISVTNPLRAITAYRQYQDEIGLVILDFMMPVMDGSELFDELRSINPHVPVMLSSGFAEHEKVKTMLAHGLLGFLPKPYTSQKLISHVRSTLDGLKA